ncbi:MAG: hypothetical protein RML37_06115 [Chitinophagales bacterium]|nr:hypothetical protein [Chitinophagales bacterium]
MGVPPAALRSYLAQAAGVGLATGCAVAPAAPALWLFFNGAGAAASLRSRPTHPSPGWRTQGTHLSSHHFTRYTTHSSFTCLIIDLTIHLHIYASFSTGQAQCATCPVPF